MKKKSVGVIITNSIFGVLFIGFAFLAISIAFNASYAIDLEYAITNKFEWNKFSLLLWSIVGIVVCCFVMVCVFVASDDKVNKQTKTRVRKNSFQ